jgi:hypothetical protein
VGPGSSPQSAPPAGPPAPVAARTTTGMRRASTSQLPNGAVVNNTRRSEIGQRHVGPESQAHLAFGGFGFGCEVSKPGGASIRHRCRDSRVPRPCAGLAACQASRRSVGRPRRPRACSAAACQALLGRRPPAVPVLATRSHAEATGPHVLTVRTAHDRHVRRGGSWLTAVPLLRLIRLLKQKPIRHDSVSDKEDSQGAGDRTRRDTPCMQGPAGPV